MSFSRLQSVRDQFRKHSNFWCDRCGIQPRSLVTPLIFAALASLLDAASCAFLVPTLKLLLGEPLKYQSVFGIRTVDVLAYLGSPSEPQLLTALLLTTSFLMLGRILAQYYSKLRILALTRDAATNLKSIIFERYLILGKLYFDRSNPGRLLQICTQYVEAILGEFASFNGAILGALCLIGYLAIMFLISGMLATIVLLVFPALHLMVTRAIVKIRSRSRTVLTQNNQLGLQISNTLACLPLIKSYCGEALELERFRRTGASIASLRKSVDRSMLLIEPLNEILLMSMVVLLFASLITVRSFGHIINLSSFLVFTFILKRASLAVSNIAFWRTQMASVHGYVEEINSLFVDDDKHIVRGGAVQFDGEFDRITFRNLTYDYDRFTVLKGLNFSIRSRQTTAIIGHTGSGKTTLINLVARFYDVPPGTIWIDDRDLRSFTLESWFAHVAMVGQEAYLFNASLRENILYGLKREVADEELAAVLRLTHLSELIDTLPDGLDWRVGTAGVTLSGGEKQRIAIARAILKKPQIVILDEATSALDSITEAVLQKSLSDVFRKKTILMIAHRLATVMQADRIVVLEKGELLEDGTAQDLIASKGRFFDYWQRQQINLV